MQPSENERVLEFFQRNAAEALSLVFKPRASTIEDKLAFLVVIRVYALEITVPQPPLTAKGFDPANAWVPESPSIKADHEYTATVWHQAKSSDDISWAERHNGVANEWFVTGNRVQAQQAVAGCELIDTITRSLPIELFFVHQKDRFCAWQELRANIIRDMAEKHIAARLERDRGLYY